MLFILKDMNLHVSDGASYELQYWPFVALGHLSMSCRPVLANVYEGNGHV